MLNTSKSLSFRLFQTHIYDPKGREYGLVRTEYDERGFIYDGGEPDQHWKTTIFLNEEYPFYSGADATLTEHDWALFVDSEQALKLHFEYMSEYAII